MACGAAFHLAAGETLFAQGARHAGIFHIQSGLVRTFYTSPAGREITLACWLPGNIVGTPYVLSSSVHMWSGIAVQDSQVTAFQGEDVRNLMRAIPEFAIGIVEVLEFKGRCLSSLLQMLGTRSVSERLAILLINLAEIHGVKERDGISIGSPFTHEVLAQMAGASRQWITMTLDRFQSKGLVRVARLKTLILDPEGLRKRVPASERRRKHN
jgi:CRP-like cAMP-binding protein